MAGRAPPWVPGTGLQALRTALDLAQHSGSPAGQPGLQAGLAEAHRLAGDLEGAAPLHQ
jgi:hypothetical protein